eukprot:TRINITY_DN6305_c0_g4_i2.p1 TRINITY_DN6305_c0_g4~~TRINITY_DN6305_c0_g4_i2.p1  ORF type:complete len:1984 (+),score=505.99 TRINITY_DN6305_c0_g4_i2:78-5954(+)
MQGVWVRLSAAAARGASVVAGVTTDLVLRQLRPFLESLFDSHLEGTVRREGATLVMRQTRLKLDKVNQELAAAQAPICACEGSRIDFISAAVREDYNVTLSVRGLHLEAEVRPPAAPPPAAAPTGLGAAGLVQAPSVDPSNEMTVEFTTVAGDADDSTSTVAEILNQLIWRTEVDIRGIVVILRVCDGVRLRLDIPRLTARGKPAKDASGAEGALSPQLALPGGLTLYIARGGGWDPIAAVKPGDTSVTVELAPTTGTQANILSGIACVVSALLLRVDVEHAAPLVDAADQVQRIMKLLPPAEQPPPAPLNLNLKVHQASFVSGRCSDRPPSTGKEVVLSAEQAAALTLVETPSGATVCAVGEKEGPAGIVGCTLCRGGHGPGLREGEWRRLLEAGGEVALVASSPCDSLAATDTSDPPSLRLQSGSSERSCVELKWRQGRHQGADCHVCPEQHRHGNPQRCDGVRLDQFEGYGSVRCAPWKATLHVEALEELLRAALEARRAAQRRKEVVTVQHAAGPHSPLQEDPTPENDATFATCPGDQTTASGFPHARPAGTDPTMYSFASGDPRQDTMRTCEMTLEPSWRRAAPPRLACQARPGERFVKNLTIDPVEVAVDVQGRDGHRLDLELKAEGSWCGGNCSGDTAHVKLSAAARLYCGAAAEAEADGRRDGEGEAAVRIEITEVKAAFPFAPQDAQPSLLSPLWGDLAGGSDPLARGLPTVYARANRCTTATRPNVKCGTLSVNISRSPASAVAAFAVASFAAASQAPAEGEEKRTAGEEKKTVCAELLLPEVTVSVAGAAGATAELRMTSLQGCLLSLEGGSALGLELQDARLTIRAREQQEPEVLLYRPGHLQSDQAFWQQLQGRPGGALLRVVAQWPTGTDAAPAYRVALDRAVIQQPTRAVFDALAPLFGGAAPAAAPAAAAPPPAQPQPTPAVMLLATDVALATLPATPPAREGSPQGSDLSSSLGSFAPSAAAAAAAAVTRAAPQPAPALRLVLAVQRLQLEAAPPAAADAWAGAGAAGGSTRSRAAECAAGDSVRSRHGEPGDSFRGGADGASEVWCSVRCSATGLTLMAGDNVGNSVAQVHKSHEGEPWGGMERSLALRPYEVGDCVKRRDGKKFEESGWRLSPGETARIVEVKRSPVAGGAQLLFLANRHEKVSPRPFYARQFTRAHGVARGYEPLLQIAPTELTHSVPVDAFLSGVLQVDEHWRVCHVSEDDPVSRQGVRCDQELMALEVGSRRHGRGHAAIDVRRLVEGEAQQGKHALCTFADSQAALKVRAELGTSTHVSVEGACVRIEADRDLIAVLFQCGPHFLDSAEDRAAGQPPLTPPTPARPAAAPGSRLLLYRVEAASIMEHRERAAAEEHACLPANSLTAAAVPEQPGAQPAGRCCSAGSHTRGEVLWGTRTGNLLVRPCERCGVHYWMPFKFTYQDFDNFSVEKHQPGRTCTPAGQPLSPAEAAARLQAAMAAPFPATPLPVRFRNGKVKDGRCSDIRLFLSEEGTLLIERNGSLFSNPVVQRVAFVRSDPGAPQEVHVFTEPAAPQSVSSASGQVSRPGVLYLRPDEAPLLAQCIRNLAHHAGVPCETWGPQGAHGQEADGGTLGWVSGMLSAGARGVYNAAAAGASYITGSPEESGLQQGEVVKVWARVHEEVMAALGGLVVEVNLGLHGRLFDDNVHVDVRMMHRADLTQGLCIRYAQRPGEGPSAPPLRGGMVQVRDLTVVRYDVAGVMDKESLKPDGAVPKGKHALTLALFACGAPPCMPHGRDECEVVVLLDSAPWRLKIDQESYKRLTIFMGSEEPPQQRTTSPGPAPSDASTVADSVASPDAPEPALSDPPSAPCPCGFFVRSLRTSRLQVKVDVSGAGEIISESAGLQGAGKWAMSYAPFGLRGTPLCLAPTDVCGSLEHVVQELRGLVSRQVGGWIGNAMIGVVKQVGGSTRDMALGSVRYLWSRGGL